MANQKSLVWVRGRYKGQNVELEQPLNLPEGTVVEIVVQPLDKDQEKTDWSNLGMSRLEEEWDNPQDAIYDNWKKLYGVQGG